MHHYIITLQNSNLVLIAKLSDCKTFTLEEFFIKYSVIANCLS